MHDSMKRLHEVTGITRKNVLAKQLKVSPSTVTNWGTRGVSKEGALDAAELYGVDANYILDGSESRKNIAINDAPINSGGDTYIEGSNSKMPVFSKVSVNSYKDMGSSDIIDWLPIPSHLSPNPFAFIVAGRAMMPEFKANEIVVVDTNVTIDQLKDGQFVVVQHEGDDYAVLKQVNLGAGVNDVYLKQLNDSIPNAGLLQINQFNLLGIVDSKITKYR